MHIFFCQIVNDKWSTEYGFWHLFQSTAMLVLLSEISICEYAYLYEMFVASKTLMTSTI